VQLIVFVIETVTARVLDYPKGSQTLRGTY
jgi:hypothetical protein